MLDTALLNTLLNAGLPGHGYTVTAITPEERDARIAALLGTRGVLLQESPFLTIVASEAGQSVRLITRPGHFAHPSILERRLVLAADGHSIAVSVTTCASLDLATQWVNQFKEQDVQVRKALAT